MAIRDDVADVLIDFAAIITEEIAVEIGASLDFEDTVMKRIAPILSRLRNAESLLPEDTYRGK